MQETIAEYTAPMEFSRTVRNITAFTKVAGIEIAELNRFLK